VVKGAEQQRTATLQRLGVNDDFQSATFDEKVGE
jgi:hypothetical protein